MQGARYLALVAGLALLGLALPVPIAQSTTDQPSQTLTAHGRQMPQTLTATEPRPVEVDRERPVEVTSPELPPRVVTWDLPVTRNERVEFWIRFLSGYNREKTALWLQRSGRYGPMTRDKLRERGMPEDLLYLALIESGFSPSAYSRAKAVGLWQFIEETGRRYGLKVSRYVDERRDPLKATDAALDYLQELYGRFGSWYLAAAAYNTGENRVERILREQAGNARGDEELYWRISPYLPRETRDYVPLMLAAGHIGKEPARYGFEDLEYHPALAYDTVRASGGTSLALIAQAIGVEPAEVFDLNQHYVLKVTPPGRAADVRIPQGRSLAFESNFGQGARKSSLPSMKRGPALTTARLDDRVLRAAQLVAH